MHHFKQFRDDFRQQIRLFTNDFFLDNFCEGQDVLQPVQESQRYMVDLVLFFQELNSQALPSAVDMPVASTDLERKVGNPEDSLCD